MGNMAMPLSSSHTILNPIYNISPPKKKTTNKLWGEFNVLRQYYLKIKNLRGEPHFKSKRIVLWLYNIPNTFSNRKLNQMGWKVQYFTTTYTCIHKISWTPFPIRKKAEEVQNISATLYLLTPPSIWNQKGDQYYVTI